jgi:hypothetical protein
MHCPLCDGRDNCNKRENKWFDLRNQVNFDSESIQSHGHGETTHVMLRFCGDNGSYEGVLKVRLERQYLNRLSRQPSGLS